MPPPDNPELALVLAGVPDSLAQTGGDLYAVIVNVAVNAWMAGHIHGEDGCIGCDGSRGPAGHDWEARMRTITELQPDVTKWCDRDVRTRAVNDAGYAVTRRCCQRAGTACPGSLAYRDDVTPGASCPTLGGGGPVRRCRPARRKASARRTPSRASPSQRP